MGLSVNSAKHYAKAFAANLNFSMPYDFKIRPSWHDLYGQPGLGGGGYHAAETPGNRAIITIAAGSHPTPAALNRTLQHEILGHMMLNTYPPETKAHILENIIAARGSEGLAATWDKVDHVYKDVSLGRRAEEVYAHIAERVDLENTPVPANDPIVSESGPLSANQIESSIAYRVDEMRNGKLQFQTFPSTDVHSTVENRVECRNRAAEWLSSQPDTDTNTAPKPESRSPSP